MADSVQEELEEVTASRLWAGCSGLVNCVIQQTVPRDSFEDGAILYGQAGTPFLSVSSILPEQFNDSQGWNDRDAITRAVTVVLYAERLNVQRSRGLFLKIRERAIRSIQKYRWTLAQSGSCVLYGNVRPQSQLVASAWIQQGRFISAFDVMFRTLEPRNHS